MDRLNGLGGTTKRPRQPNWATGYRQEPFNFRALPQELKFEVLKHATGQHLEYDDEIPYALGDILPGLFHREFAPTTRDLILLHYRTHAKILTPAFAYSQLQPSFEIGKTWDIFPSCHLDAWFQAGKLLVSAPIRALIAIEKRA
ncbi:hypothetical protein M8818_005945 [Zalaria obscura]|uniref:Uncharacterized protein n=1 Tax=Zalaria obscura TaxID=2024903 RepID=A0ACC3S748_9PEZI